MSAVGLEHGPWPTCRRLGRHSRFLYRRRRGPFWARRDEYRCMTCNAVIDQAAFMFSREPDGH